MPLIDQPDTPELIDHQNSFAEGVVNNREPHLLTPFQAFHLQDAIPGIDGRLKKAHGHNPRGPANIDALLKKAYGFYGFEVLDQSQRDLMVQYRNELYRFSDHQALSPFGWQRVASNVSFVETFHMGVQGAASLLPAFFMCACVSASSTGASYSRIAHIGAAPNYSAGFTAYNVMAKGLAWFQRRLWGINDIGVFWSKLNDGNTRPAGEPDIALGSSGDADPNMALMPLRDPTPRLLIFRRNSVWLLDIFWTTDGFYPTSADTMDFTKAQLRPIVEKVGLMAPRAVTWIPGAEGGDFLFLSREGIRSLSRSITDAQGGASLPLSWKIQRIIDQINWSSIESASAHYSNGIAYFSLPTMLSSGVNSTVIAYDVRYDHFYVHDWLLDSFVTMKYPEREPAMYGVGSWFISENYTSPGVNLAHMHVYDTSSGLYTRNNDTTPPAYAPQFDVQTRDYPFDIGDPVGSGIKQKKRYNRLEIGVKPGETTASFLVSYRVNGASDWTALGAFRVLSTDLGLQKRMFSLRKIKPARTLAFRVQETTGVGQPEIEYIQVTAMPLNPNVE